MKAFTFFLLAMLALTSADSLNTLARHAGHIFKNHQLQNNTLTTPIPQQSVPDEIDPLEAMEAENVQNAETSDLLQEEKPPTNESNSMLSKKSPVSFLKPVPKLGENDTGLLDDEQENLDIDKLLPSPEATESRSQLYIGIGAVVGCAVAAMIIVIAMCCGRRAQHNGFEQIGRRNVP